MLATNSTSSDTIAMIALVLPVCAGITTWVVSVLLTHKGFRSWLAESFLSEHWAKRYRLSIKKLLTWLDQPKRMGKAWSSRSFFLCWSFACVYPLLLIIFGWLFGGETITMAGKLFLPDMGIYHRVGTVCGIMGFSYLLFKWFTSWGLKLNDRLKIYLKNKFPNNKIGLFNELLVLTLYIGGTFLIMYTLKCIFNSYNERGAVVAVLTLAMVSSFFRLGLTFLHTSIALIIFSYTIGYGDNFVIVSYVILFYMLPLLNACMDFVSQAVSRILARDILKKSLPWNILAHIIIDLILAILFLILLAAILPFSIELVNLVAGEITIDWRQYIEKAGSDPWKQGLPVIGMLITTLLPTCIHLIIATFLMPLSLFSSKFWSWMIRQLTRERKKGDEDLLDRWVEFGALSILLTCSILSISLFTWLGWKFLYAIHLPVGEWLYKLVMWFGELPRALF